MLTVKNTSEFRIEKPSILTIGTFDGVHLGHQKILTRLKELKQNLGLNSTLLTFDPHPRRVLFPEQKDLKLITTTDEKLTLLKKFGVDTAIVYPFSIPFSKMDSETYIAELLVKKLNVKHLVIGYDHKFGVNRSGDLQTLKEYSNQYDFTVEEISVKDIDSISISSSKVRAALDKGDIELANKYLGYPYFITGTVVKGKQLGRTIGYPTANVDIENSEKLLPLLGVYCVSVDIDTKIYNGMLSIGKNPTTDQDDKVKIEVNLFDFDADIYAKTIKLSFLKRLRDEVKFNSIAELTEQLGKDKAECINLFKTK